MTVVIKYDEKVNVHPCMHSLRDLTVGTKGVCMQQQCIKICKLVLCSLLFSSLLSFLKFVESVSYQLFTRSHFETSSCSCFHNLLWIYDLSHIQHYYLNSMYYSHCIYDRSSQNAYISAVILQWIYTPTL